MSDRDIGILLLILALILGWCAVALGESKPMTIPVSLVHGRGAHAMTKDEAYGAWLKAAAKVKDEVGINLKVVRFRSMKSRNIRLDLMYLGWVEVDRLFKQGGVKLYRRGINFAILPPLIDRKTGYWYSAGAAPICGARGGLSGFSMVTNQNPLGEDRKDYAAIDIAHELGHLLGAKHQLDASIMNEAAMQYGTDLHFDEASKSEVTKCLN